MRVGEQRCASTPPADDALALAVRFEAGETRYVVLELDVPASMTAETARAVIADVGNVLRDRVAQAMAPPPVVVVQEPQYATPLAQDLPPAKIDLRAFSDKEGWHRVRRHDPGRVAAIVLGSAAVGVAMVVGMGFLMASAMSSMHWAGNYGY